MLEAPRAGMREQSNKRGYLQQQHNSYIGSYVIYGMKLDANQDVSGKILMIKILTHPPHHAE